MVYKSRMLSNGDRPAEKRRIAAGALRGLPPARRPLGTTIPTVVLLCLALAGCEGGPLATQLGLAPVGGYISLKAALPGEWTRVCVIGPYADNEHAREILGTNVNIQTRSSVYHSDSFALLVTMMGDSVTALYDVYRKPSDFTKLAGECFARDDTMFFVPDTGHPFVEQSL